MSCCAVIVTFYPDSDVSESISALRDQVNDIVIVDNGSKVEHKDMLQKISQQYDSTIIYNEQNLGIAAALNIGIKLAKERGHEWVITFDQDSQVTLGMVETMLTAYATYPQQEKVASLSPRYMNKNTGNIWRSKVSGNSSNNLPYCEVEGVITSGNLIKLSIFDSVGFFNEGLFIDYVDKEFCLRCITQDYKILEAKDAILLHMVGLPTKVNLLWNSSITTTNHSYLRRYYIARNSIFTYRTYLFEKPFWVLIDLYYLIGNLSKAIIFEPNKKRRLAATALGFYDGFLNKLGKCTRIF